LCLLAKNSKKTSDFTHQVNTFSNSWLCFYNFFNYLQTSLFLRCRIKDIFSTLPHHTGDAKISVMINKDNQLLIANLRRFFQKRKQIVIAFLFGSQAKSRTISESDIDIAIWPEGGLKMKDLDKLWQELELITQKDVDIVRLNRANPTVAWAALRGIPLIIRDRKLYIQLLLNISDEAEFMQDFNLDLYKIRQNLLSKKDKNNDSKKRPKTRHRSKA